MSKATPRPWKYYSGNRGIYSSRQNPKDERAIATMCGPRGEDGDRFANANLILRAVEIVGKLAEIDPEWECMFCGQYGGRDHSHGGLAKNQVVEKHAPDCIWRQAKEITA